jgi:hypothetical protein
MSARELSAHVRERRPTPFAFTLRVPFPAPSGDEIRSDDDWLCPA